ncbi:MAG: DUF4339 domain-containing protein [Proteobacteria bacterium]|nr:DUF4339 domain-containing protein [Pseudomonadota bacterium]
MSSPELPALDAAEVHVHTAGGQIGPITRFQLKEKLGAGEVSATDDYWFAGMEEWKPLSSRPELFEGLPDPSSVLSEDDRLDGVFSNLVHASWDYHSDHKFASHIDEVFLGAIITGYLDNGWSLIDINSDGTHHYLRFEDMKDHSRSIVRFTHLTPDLALSEVLGHRASVVVGYGERLKNFSKVWSAIKSEYKSGFLAGDTPGTISVDGDISSQYVYCQVPLFLKIDDYVSRAYEVDYKKLDNDLDACTHALRKYLRARFT